MGKTPWAKGRCLGIATPTFLALASIVLIGLVSYLVNQQIAQTTASSSCPSSSPCEVGTATKIDGHTACQYHTLASGSSCSSTCFTNTAAGRCNAKHVCVPNDPTTCPGYCRFNNSDTTISGVPTEFDSADCAGKLSFNSFYQWDTPQSSDYPWNWLYYSNYDPECSALGGCTWFASKVVVFQVNNNPGWLTTDATTKSCYDFINTTKPEGCFSITSFDLPPTMANILYRNSLAGFITGLSNQSNYEIMASTCVYRYQCGPSNSSVYTDPFYQQGSKRSVEGQHHHPLMAAAMKHHDPLMRPTMMQFAQASIYHAPAKLAKVVAYAKEMGVVDESQ